MRTEEELKVPREDGTIFAQGDSFRLLRSHCQCDHSSSSA